MRKLFLISVLIVCTLVFSVPAVAGEKIIEFEWNQVIGENFAGWNVYMSETSGTYSTIPFATIDYDGVELTEYTTDQIISSPDGEEKTYYFVFTAFDTSDNESGYSNEVFALIDFLAPHIPYILRIIVRSPPT